MYYRVTRPRACVHMDVCGPIRHTLGENDVPQPQLDSAPGLDTTRKPERIISTCADACQRVCARATRKREHSLP